MKCFVYQRRELVASNNWSTGNHFLTLNRFLQPSFRSQSFFFNATSLCRECNHDVELKKKDYFIGQRLQHSGRAHPSRAKICEVVGLSPPGCCTFVSIFQWCVPSWSHNEVQHIWFSSKLNAWLQSLGRNELNTRSFGKSCILLWKQFLQVWTWLSISSFGWAFSVRRDAFNPADNAPILRPIKTR